MITLDMLREFFYETIKGGSGLRLSEIGLILAAACLMGVYIYFVYKGFTKSAFYSRDLNVTIAGMGIVVAAIMIAMQANLLVSMGMVGALSIVRFRTAIKNPLDLLYLFWSISVGIICGVGLIMLAVIVCIVMTAVICILQAVPAARAPKLLIVRTAADADAAALDGLIAKHSSRHHKSSVVTKNGESEYIYEVTLRDSADLVSAVSTMEKVRSVSCLEHDGELRA